MAFGISVPRGPWTKTPTTAPKTVNPWDSANSFEQRVQAQARSTAAANNALGPGYVDPYNGASIFDLLGGMRTPSSPGGGGGGGGYSGPSAATKAAYAKMLQTLKDQQAANLGTFDTRQTSLNDAFTQGKTRLDGIMGTLTSGAAATRGTVADSYAGGDARLAQLAQQFQAMEAARSGAAGNTLQAFGANPADVTRQYGATDLVNAQRSALAGVGAADDAMYANRGNVYNAFMGDVGTQNSQGLQMLLAQLAAQKQQQQMADQQALAQLGIQAAGAGVSL
jgi:hypothetical protein